MKLFTLIALFFTLRIVTAQQTSNLLVSNTVMTTGAEKLPFWFHASQNAKLAEDAGFLNLTEAAFSTTGNLLPNKQIYYYLETNLIAGTGEASYFRANQLLTGIGYKHWQLQAGWFQNPVKYHGLSSSNGDIHWSNNIRPLPRVRLSAGYFHFSFFPSWLTIKGLYEEGWLNDATRFVQQARLHHKNVFLKFNLSANTSIVAGLDHYAQWGGIHPTLGQLPSGFGDYFRYTLGLPGSEDFIKGDQNLMAGNQLGKYVIRFNRHFTPGTLEIYLNHPFTDRMDWSNYKDNLLGIYYNFNKQRLLQSVIYEFMYTKFQRAIQRPDGSYYVPGGGAEPYFRHGIYRSGLSYQNRMFTTPFAIPLVIIDGVNYGTGNNRIVLHHIGLSGTLLKNLSWKSLLSFSKNYGTFRNNYHEIKPEFFDSPRQQVSAFGSLNYKFPKNNWHIQIAVAADKGNLMKNNAGAQITVKYKIF